MPYTEYISEKLNMFINQFIDVIPSLILSIFIFVIFYIIGEYYKIKFIDNKKIKRYDRELQSNFNIEQETTYYNNFVNNSLIYNQLNWVIYYSIITFGLLMSLVNLGFNAGIIITLLGSIGLALGLAFQETLKNMISGIYIEINKLYRLGDVISIKPINNDTITIGKIIDFNLYYTTMLNSANKITMIPNSLIQNNILINESK